MGGIGTLGAISGLSKSVDYAAQDQREFAQMQNIEQNLAKDQQANMMAQELEAKQYEEIANKAAEMLGPDRVKIQAKSIELQRNIRAKIEEYGSRKAFFENGGVALLSKYKSELLTSAETLSYSDNKKNMESIIKIQESGKGHLLSARDLKSMQDYNAGIGDGKITYSGMKSEVAIPEKYYNYQEEIPAEAILMYGSNYMAIYNNWLIENPNKKGLSGDDLKAELLQYTYQNHAGQGINETKYQNDIARRNLKEDKEEIAKAGTEKAIPISYVAAVNEGFNQIQESNPVNVADLMLPENYIKKVASTNKEFGGVLGNVDEYSDASSNYTNANFGDAITKGISRKLGIDNKYVPASAVMVPMMSKIGVVKALYPGATSLSSINAGINNSEYYSPNGEKLSDDYVKESIQDKTNQNMTFQGLIYAYVDGNGKMVTQMRDSNGKPLGKKDKTGKYIMTDEEKTHMAPYSGGLRTEMFSILTNSEGEKVYHKIPANSIKGERDLQVAIGAADNVTETVQRRQETGAIKRAKEVQKNFQAKVLKNDVAIASTTGGVFASPEFMNEAKISKVADGSNRVALHKAYYMALSALTPREGGATGMVGNDLMLKDRYYLGSNPHNFTKKVNYSKELKDALINKSKYSDQDYIKLFAETHTNGNQDDFEENEVFAQTWSKIYELINKK